MNVSLDVKTVVVAGLQYLTLRWHNENTLSMIQCWIYEIATHTSAIFLFLHDKKMHIFI